MEEPACTVKSARIDDIPSMLEFEKKYFENCWHSKPDTLHKLIKKDPMMFRLCSVGRKLKGYYGAIPLPYTVWKKILQGDITEDAAMQYVKSFDAPEIYLYIYSVIVDLADNDHKVYTRTLIRDFTRQYILKSGQKKSDIRSIGAFTVSDGGQRIVERSRFSFKGTFRGLNGKKVRSYIIKPENIIKQIVNFKEQRLKMA